MAATTFNYHGWQYNPHEGLVPEAALQSSLHGVLYAERRLQGHDESLLRRQVVNTIKEIKKQQLTGALASDDAEITIGEIIEELPETVHNIPPGKVLPGARTFDMGLTSVSDPRAGFPTGVGKVANLWGFGGNHTRLPQPYWSLLALDTPVRAHAKKIWDFVSANPGDKPVLVAVQNAADSAAVEWFPMGDQIVESPANAANDLLIAVTAVGTGLDEPLRHSSSGEDPRPCYIYWAPHFAIGEGGESKTMPLIAPIEELLADEAEYSVQFKNHGRTYQIARKEAQDLQLTNDVHCKLFGFDGAESNRSGVPIFTVGHNKQRPQPDSGT